MRHFKGDVFMAMEKRENSADEMWQKIKLLDEKHRKKNKQGIDPAYLMDRFLSLSNSRETH